MNLHPKAIQSYSVPVKSCWRQSGHVLHVCAGCWRKGIIHINSTSWSSFIIAVNMSHKLHCILMGPKNWLHFRNAKDATRTQGKYHNGRQETTLREAFVRHILEVNCPGGWICQTQLYPWQVSHPAPPCPASRKQTQKWSACIGIDKCFAYLCISLHAVFSGEASERKPVDAII